MSNDDNGFRMNNADKSALLRNVADLVSDARQRLGIGNRARYEGPPTYNQGPPMRGRRMR
jgi:hypothetical protein